MSLQDKVIQRTNVGSNFQEVCELPNLIGVQLDSYEKFLQLEKFKKGEQPNPEDGLENIFTSTFPIEIPYSEKDDKGNTNRVKKGDLFLAYNGYKYAFDEMKYSEIECKKKGTTYSVPLKANMALELPNGEIREKEIYFGDIPLMTERGTFVINGAERVVVSQIHKSPGVIFTIEKDGIYSARIVPYKGSWLEFQIGGIKNRASAKTKKAKSEDKNVLVVRFASKKDNARAFVYGSTFLRAIGLDTREQIIKTFFESEEVELNDENIVVNRYAYNDIYDPADAEKKIVMAGDQINPINITDLKNANVEKIILISEESYEKNQVILNCFAIEEDYADKTEQNKQEAIAAVLSAIFGGESYSSDRNEEAFHDRFFSKNFDLSVIGRYKFFKKFGKEGEEMDKTSSTLVPEDIINTIKHLIKVYNREAPIDDIDHLSNRRVRAVGELLQSSLKNAFNKMRISIEKTTVGNNNKKETEKEDEEGKAVKSSALDGLKPQDIIPNKHAIAAIKEFFGGSQLSQFMDQVNPLAELTHKRRITALGHGGISRDRALFDVRDVHYTHYGRLCPIETPEGPNIGLILSLANYTKINEYGFLETPYREIKDGIVTKNVKYLDPTDEENYYIAPASAEFDENGIFKEKNVPIRHQGDYSTMDPKSIRFMDVSSKQVLSVAASLIPFLEHDDANRALMGSNMQRQAVPLLFPEAPRVGTGMENKAAYDSGVLVKSHRAGTVTYVSSTEIKVKPDNAEIDGEIDVYTLQKFQRTNQDTSFNQKPIVYPGQKVDKGAVLADGPATDRGELALGRNILVGFVPWNGYNFEDAVLISERVVRDDIYTSIHIKEFKIEVRETKLGPEKITRDIPNTSDKMLENLDSDGIVTIGTYVRPGNILVGKVTPKSDSETSPEFKLLNSIFGDKAKEVRDSSLTVQHGTEGTVIDIQRIKRGKNNEDSDLLSPGVEESVTVLIAVKRKLKQGDKMAGRHGNKGVVSRILPEEDMPYMEDGTSLDVCLNPLGVPSRMNIGQLMETQLGWPAVRLNEWYKSPVFESADMKTIEAKMVEAGLPETSKVTLYDGRTGVPFVNPVFCGYIYYLKLHHLVDDKMHARSIGPYSLVTQQPLGGKAQFGGQRLGEMEVWALEAYGAANTLQELLTVKSDDMNGRVKIYESIVKGEAAQTAGMPEAFNVLVQEIRGLALDMSVYDSNQKQVPLTERDIELFKKKDKGSL